MPIINVHGSQNMRDIIISILSRQWPLSAKEVFTDLKRNGIHVTYQAVHKALQQMVAEGVLTFKDKGYQLDIAWIKNLRSFTEKAEKAYTRNASPPKLEIGIGSSVEKDAFAAGKEAAEKALASIKHGKDLQLALVFASSIYEQDFKGLLKGIHSIAKQAQIAGCTSLGGEVCDRALSKSVVVALFSAAVQDFTATPFTFPVNADYYNKMPGAIIDKLTAAQQQNRFDCGIIFFPGFTLGNSMAEGEASDVFLRMWGERGDKRFPLVGCLAGDEWKFEKSYAFCNSKVLSNTLMFVGIKTKVKFGIGMQHAYTRLNDKVYTVHTEGDFVSAFSCNEGTQMPATDVYRKVANLSQKELEKIIPSYIKEAISQNKNPPLGRDGSSLVAFPILVQGTKIRFETDFKDGEKVRFLKTTPEQMLEASYRSMQEAMRMGNISKPYGAVVFPCAIFELILAKVSREIDYLKKQRMFSSVPFVGCSAGGEIGMRQGGECTRGNGTFTTLLFGE